MTAVKFITQETPKGKGVFTSAPIRAREFLFSYRGSGPLLTYQEAKDPSREAYCLQIGHDKYIWTTQSPQCYVNHSCEPNTGLRNVTELYALRDIKTGEEVTCDYSATMDEDDWEMDCLCGTPTCRGRIRDFKYLSRELQQRYIQLGIVAAFCLKPRVSRSLPLSIAEGGLRKADCRKVFSIRNPKSEIRNQEGGEAPTICTNCNGACCCQNGVQGLISTPFLTPEDVERIKEATGMDESEFAIESAQVALNPKNPGFPLPAGGQRGGGGESIGTRAPIDTQPLGHIKQMRTKPSGHGCMFFNEETRLCNIYSARPLDCRLFPLDIIREDGKIYLILHTELCSINQAVLDAYVQYAQAHLIPLIKPHIREYTTINMELVRRISGE